MPIVKCAFAVFLLPAMVCAMPAAAAEQTAERIVLLPIAEGAPWSESTTDGRWGRWTRKMLPAGQDFAGHTDEIDIEYLPDHQSDTPGWILSHGEFSISCTAMRPPNYYVTEGGYKAVYKEAYCPPDASGGQATEIFIKWIFGDSALWVTSRDIRVPPRATPLVVRIEDGTTPEEKAGIARELAVSRYMRSSVFLCGGASTEPRCESPVPAQTGAKPGKTDGPPQAPANGSGSSQSH